MRVIFFSVILLHAACVPEFGLDVPSALTPAWVIAQSSTDGRDVQISWRSARLDSLPLDVLIEVSTADAREELTWSSENRGDPSFSAPARLSQLVSETLRSELRPGAELSLSFSHQPATSQPMPRINRLVTLAEAGLLKGQPPETPGWTTLRDRTVRIETGPLQTGQTIHLALADIQASAAESQLSGNVSVSWASSVTLEDTAQGRIVAGPDPVVRHEVSKSSQNDTVSTVVNGSLALGRLVEDLVLPGRLPACYDDQVCPVCNPACYSDTIDARVAWLNDDVAILLDETHPPGPTDLIENELTDALEDLATTLDTSVLPRMREWWGDFGFLDHAGRLLIVMSPVYSDPNTAIVGIQSPVDLYRRDSFNGSNEAAMIYTARPGRHSNGELIATMTHELQHLLNHRWSMWGSGAMESYPPGPPLEGSFRPVNEAWSYFAELWVDAGHEPNGPLCTINSLFGRNRQTDPDTAPRLFSRWRDDGRLSNYGASLLWLHTVLANSDDPTAALMASRGRIPLDPDDWLRVVPEDPVSVRRQFVLDLLAATSQQPATLANHPFTRRWGSSAASGLALSGLAIRCGATNDTLQPPQPGRLTGDAGTLNLASDGILLESLTVSRDVPEGLILTLEVADESRQLWVGWMAP